MADFPGVVLPIDDRSCGAIHPMSGWSLGPAISNAAAAATSWGATNEGLFVPFRVPVPVTVYQMACGTGTGTTGNFDLGIYDGGGNLIVSTGSTAKTTASSERIVNVTDTLLLPGLYYLAMAVDGTANYVFLGSPATAETYKLLGIRRVASVFPLPSSVTLASSNSARCPHVAAYLRSE